MSTAVERRARLIDELRDKRYRHRFASATARRGLAEQIREMRLRRGWTQAQLARVSGKVQETISQLEDPNYGSYTLKTLQRLAEALDVALIVRFAPFSELADWMVDLKPEKLAVPDFDHDPGLRPGVGPIEPASTGAFSPPVQVGWSGRDVPRLRPFRTPPLAPITESASTTSDHLPEEATSYMVAESMSQLLAGTHRLSA